MLIDDNPHDQMLQYQQYVYAQQQALIAIQMRRNRDQIYDPNRGTWVPRSQYNPQEPVYHRARSNDTDRILEENERLLNGPEEQPVLVEEYQGARANPERLREVMALRAQRMQNGGANAGGFYAEGGRPMTEEE